MTMSNLAASLHTKLLNVAHDTKISFQDLLQRYGSEQFLARLSVSAYADRFIFKGGSLLAYLIDTERQTKDLDFSIRQISNKVDEALIVIRKILEISLDDGLTWSEPTGDALNHPEMDYPGVRIKCDFKLGKAKGVVRMDLAIGDLVEAKKIFLERIRYRGEPLVGDDFHIVSYPPETIFSEKLQIALKRGGNNTRMKDYYDLFKLSQLDSLDLHAIKKSIAVTFTKRGTDVVTKIDFDKTVIDQLQIYWSGFVRKMKLTDVPALINEVIEVINRRLKEIDKV